jgi:hypothetical protein
MTTRIWKTKYVRKEVLPAFIKAGYAITDIDGMIKVFDPDTGNFCFKAFAIDRSDQLVRFDRRLFDDTLEAEYPNGMK